MVRARKQAAQAASGQEYGRAKEQIDAQAEAPLPANVLPLPVAPSAGPLKTPDAFGQTVRPDEPIWSPPMPRGPAAQPTGHTHQRAQKLGIIIPGLLATMGSSDFVTPATRKVLRQYEASIVPLTVA